MFIRLFYTLRHFGIPVSTQELLDLNRALAAGVVFADQQQFYLLSRSLLVKDERFFDKFDRAFTAFVTGIAQQELSDLLTQLQQLPKAWLELEQLEKSLTPAQRAALQRAQSLEQLLEMLAERLQQQQHKHQGGNRMIGTAGSSAFGGYGDHPEGIRMAGPARQGSAVKVWQQRRYQNLDAEQQLGLRQLQMILRRLRKFARQGAAEELDIDATIQHTAAKGLLDLQLVPERRNRIKLLLLFDIGGSMDAHVAQCQQWFAAAKSEFKHLAFFYFHNCVYDYLWKDNSRVQHSRIASIEVLQRYAKDYRLIVVGDASMAPYELGSVGGSVGYHNTETGAVWLKRFQQHFDKSAWLNPEPLEYWSYTPSIGMISDIFAGQMYPMSLQGIEDMIRVLAR
jgi:uncharacterized protein with von Willebrand factor type A (vWA) domain